MRLFLRTPYRVAMKMDVEIPKSAFNPLYLPLLREDACRYLVLYGGAGSGKSVFAAQRLLVRLLEKPLCNLLVVRAVAAANRDSAYALFRQVIARWGLEGLFKWTDSDMRITCANGNSVIFKGLDNTEKLKSVTFPKGELTDIWIEEASEIEEQDFNQLDLRLRGRGGGRQITLTFNPVSPLHWLKRRFFDRQDPRAVVQKSTYKDNCFLDQAYQETLEGYRETDPYYYQVYCLGEWGVSSQSVFAAGRIAKRLESLKEPAARGDFTFSTSYSPMWNRVLIEEGSVRFADSALGAAKVYALPEKGKRYVIGGDTAGEGSDFSVAQVVDGDTGQQVCTLRGQMDEDVFARQVYCLGKWYNTALIALEANFSSYPIRTLENLCYPRQYVRQGEQALGFRTTAGTRPVILAELVEIVREHTGWICDRTTLEEMLSFVRTPQGRPEAQPGAHDDCVMALAIAYHARRQMDPPEVFWGCAVSRGRGY